MTQGTFERLTTGTPISINRHVNVRRYSDYVTENRSSDTQDGNTHVTLGFFDANRTTLVINGNTYGLS